MLASILNFILYSFFVYLIVYGIYLLTVNLKSLLYSETYLNSNSPDYSKLKEIVNHKICVIIFANSKSKRLEPLLHALNGQTYDKQNYSVHVVFAKDSNSLLYTPDCMAGAQIHCVENPEFFSKNKALSVFTEKLIKDSKFDAYVFLGPDRSVMSNYLEIINYTLNESQAEIITGKTTVVPEFKNHMLRAKVIEAREEFKNNTVNISRLMYNLMSVIDGENCVIRSEILEKTGRVCFETRDDELKYSLFLASNGIKPLYSPYIETIIDAENYNPTAAGFSVRFALFKYYLKLLYNKPWYFVEFVLSLMQPNVAVVFILYLSLLYTSFNFISTIGMKYVLHLGVFYFASWAIGLIAAKLGFVKTMAFFMYPIYSFGFNFKKITKDISKKSLQKTITEERNIKSASMDAYVTDGKREVVCKMDLISEDGMRRVILRFRKKRVISNESIRMCDAVENISKRIKSHGYTLKICQNCVNFKATQDGTVDLLKGTCKVNSGTAGGTDDTIETLIWNTCNCFYPKQLTNVIENLGGNK